jgi:hypothetical protein
LEKDRYLIILGYPTKNRPQISTRRKYCRAIGATDLDAEFHAESESAVKITRQYL